MSMQLRSSLSLASEKFIFLLLRIAAVGILFLAGNFLARSTSNFTGGPILCTFRLVTDLPCPICGTTRAFGSLSQGNVSESLNFNPLALVLAGVISMWALKPQLTHKFSDRFAQFWWRSSERKRLFVVLLILSLFWVANTPRMLNA